VVRQVCPILLSTYPIWILYDWWVQPQWFVPFALLRSFGFVGALASLAWGWRAERSQSGLGLWLWTMAAPVGAMLALVDGEVLVDYTVGFTLFVIGSGVLGTWTTRRGLIVQGGLAALAAFPLLLRPVPAGARDWAMSIGYLATVLLLARLIAQARYQAAHREFLARTWLEAEKQETERLRAEAVADRAKIERAHATLRLRDEQKTHFFQNISHELRTPLTLILAPLEEVLARRADPDLEIAARNGRRMLRLVNQLLEFQRLSVGRRVFHRQAIDGAAFLDAARELVGHTAAVRGIELSVDVAEGVPPVSADPDALEKALFNYLSNALKFTPRGGRVTLGLESVEAGVRFSVRDTGPGLSDEAQNVLFELFSQVDSGTTREVEGTGLGLALVKELVQGMGGEVGVTSAEGRGSTFWFTLPTAVGSAQVVSLQGQDWLLADSEEGPDATPTPAGGGAHSVLVVDDLPDMRRMVRRMLEEAGHRVREAGDGEEALRAIGEELPDLVVTDWMMPRVSGIELIEALRASESTRAVPVVLLTAKSDAGSRLTGLEVGADAFVGKPFDRRELVSAVRNLLALKQREAELELARQRAEAADHAKSAFLANMSHELRTPLTVILGYTQLLREDPDLDPALDADLGRVESAGTYLLQLISDILDLSKVAAGQLEVGQTPIEPSELLADLEPLAVSLCSTNRNRFRASVPSALPTILGDPVRLRQVLLNLLSNAAKFTSDGEVTLAAGADRETVWISVSDTGIGIDEARQGELFQPFVQVHGHSPAMFGGTGLGLSLSRQLAHMMGGEVTVASIPGEGSTFTVRLPRASGGDVVAAPASEQPQPEPAPEPPADGAGGGTPEA